MDHTVFKRFGVMLDLSRNAVMNLPSLKRFAALLAKMGYNTLLLYTEDTYEVEGQPYFGYLRGRYSREEIREIVAYCDTLGMEVIPCIQTLAHLNAIMRWPMYEKICDASDILLAGDERTYALIEDMFRAIKSCYKTDILHIGMDEAHLVGLGKYLDKNGFENRFEILSKHLERVCALAEKHGFKPVMWSDMFFRLGNNGIYSSDQPVIADDLEEKIPKSVDLTFWNYYTAHKKTYRAMFRAHRKLGRKTWFAGGVHVGGGFAPRNRFAIKMTKAALEVCREERIENVFLTFWGDDGAECSWFSVLPALYAAAAIAKGETSIAEIREGFKKEFGIPFGRFCNLDLHSPKPGMTAADSRFNPDKYMLYNDPFLGVMDSTVAGGEGEIYRSFSKKLALLQKHPEYGYLFEKEKALCDVLALKFELGLRTRAAYQAGDRGEMKKIAADYARLEKKLAVFLDAHRKAWFRENKPHGFDVQELRVGGLLQRMKTCKNRLKAWITDGTPIPELEETLLDFKGNGENFGKEIIYCKGYSKIATVNVFSHRSM